METTETVETKKKCPVNTAGALAIGGGVAGAAGITAIALAATIATGGAAAPLLGAGIGLLVTAAFSGAVAIGLAADPATAESDGFNDNAGVATGEARFQRVSQRAAGNTERLAETVRAHAAARAALERESRRETPSLFRGGQDAYGQEQANSTTRRAAQ